MNNHKNTFFFSQKVLFVFILFSILLPQNIFAQENSTTNENQGEVSKAVVEKSVLNIFPEKIKKPIQNLIDKVEIWRKDQNIFAEKEMLRLKDKLVEPPAPVDPLAGSDISKGGLDYIKDQVLYYLYFVWSFITSQVVVFWLLIFFFIFAILRGILRSVF